MSNRFSIGVAIPVYKNLKGLRDCIESIKNLSPALLNSFTVVDDSGNGEIANQLQKEFSEINWIINERNLGFGQTANKAVLMNSADIVILLNDDTKLLSAPIEHLQKAFQNEELFAVTFASVTHEGNFREGAKQLVWRGGFPKILHNPKDQLPIEQGYHFSSYAVGGHAAYRKRMFAELKGFDPLFDPFYWEDADLCMRASDRGWNTIYMPECKVKHDGPSSIRSSHERKFIQEVTQRNRILFAWRYIKKSQVISHKIFLWLRVCESFFTFNLTFYHAYQKAKMRWAEYKKSRS